MKKINKMGNNHGTLSNRIIEPINEINNPVKKDVVVSRRELVRHFSVVALDLFFR